MLRKKIFNNYFVKEKAKCLDLGCGTGRTTYFLKKKGLNVLGTDIVPAMIKAAKKLYPGIKFKVVNAVNLSEFKDESFDYVLFSCIGLDYIFPESKRRRCLKEVYRVLKKGGVFAFSTSNSFCLPYYSEMIKMKLYNLSKLNIFSTYKWAFEGKSRSYVHYINPFKQRKVLKKIGFRNVRLFGRNSKGGLVGSIFFDNAPYYVCVK